MKRKQEGSHLQAKERGPEQILPLWFSGKIKLSNTLILNFQPSELKRIVPKERGQSKEQKSDHQETTEHAFLPSYPNKQKTTSFRSDISMAEKAFPHLCPPPPAIWYPYTDRNDLVGAQGSNTKQLCRNCQATWQESFLPMHWLIGIQTQVLAWTLQWPANQLQALSAAVWKPLESTVYLRQSPTDKSTFVKVWVSSGEFSAHFWSNK